MLYPTVVNPGPAASGKAAPVTGLPPALDSRANLLSRWAEQYSTQTGMMAFQTVEIIPLSPLGCWAGEANRGLVV